MSLLLLCMRVSSPNFMKSVKSKLEDTLIIFCLLFDKKPWGNSYKMPPVEPDAVAYASQFYASHHIPSYNRPGNNFINTNKYQKYTTVNGQDNYNFSCHTTNVI